MDATVAELVDQLFRTHLRPDGREYGYKELSDASNGEFSPRYFAKLRKGDIKSPGRDGLLFLCKFFRVPASYFFPELDELAPNQPREDERIQIVLRSSSLSEEVQHHLQALIKAIGQEEKGTNE
jgi:transcriptional regulator with XRE-family HTH domain